MISNGRRKHSPQSNLEDEKTFAKVVCVVERASRAVGSQSAASSAKSILRMGRGQCFKGEKMICVGCDRVGVEVRGGGLVRGIISTMLGAFQRLEGAGIRRFVPGDGTKTTPSGDGNT